MLLQLDNTRIISSKDHFKGGHLWPPFLYVNNSNQYIVLAVMETDKSKMEVLYLIEVFKESSISLSH